MVVLFKANAVHNSFKSREKVLNLSYTCNFKSNFQHYYKSYGDYLLKMGHMDEEQAIFD